MTANLPLELHPGRYRHFKGGEYEVLGLVRHSETDQRLVLYRPLYGEGALWIRPLSHFFDLRPVDGELRPRFERIGEPEPGALQARVAAFCRAHGLTADPSVRLLDLCSELGELAKVWLKASGYGRQPTEAGPAADWVDEYGDVLFALLSLANETGVSAEAALDGALAKYRQRLARTGQAGSGAKPAPPERP